MSTAIGRADWLRLGDGERIVWHGQPSLYRIWDSLVLAAVLAVGGLVLVGGVVQVDPDVPWFARLSPLALLVLAAAIGASAYLRWRSVHYVVTSNEVYRKSGNLSRDVAQVRIDSIQNTTYEQSAIQRLLGYGDVRLYTAGSGTMDLVLADVPDPAGVSAVVGDRLDATARREGRA